MRLARLVGVGLGLSLAAATGGAQQPTGVPPEVTLWSPSSANLFMSAGGRETYFVGVDRDAYVAAFEVGRDGRVRVLYPRSPKDAGRVQAGKTVAVSPWGYDLLGSFVSPSDVPYVIALSSDEPIDLAPFGTGKQWQYRVRLDHPQDADGTMERVARLVARDPSQRFGADFGYVAPRITASQQMALARCTSLSTLTAGRDAHDYWLYRDLWMSFGPRDAFWFSSVSPWIGWGWNGFAPLLFPSAASWPVRGGGCSSTLRLPSYAYAPLPLQLTPNNPWRPDTTRRDSTRADSTRTMAGGRAVAVEAPRGGAGGAMSPAEAARRFSREDIARIRTEHFRGPDGNAASAEAIASRHDGAAVDRRGGSWAPEPLGRRPGSSATSHYAEQEERVGPRVAGPSRGRPGRVDPEGVYTPPLRNGSAATGGASGTTNWQRPTSVGGADVTRNAVPVAAPPAGVDRGSPVSTPVTPAATGTPGTPRGQQQ